MWHVLFCHLDLLSSVILFHALFCGSATCSILYVCRAVFCYHDMFYSMDVVYVYLLCHDFGMLYSIIVVTYSAL